MIGRFCGPVADEVIEVSRVYPGGSFERPVSYDDFAEKREAFLEAQTKQQESVANQVRRETDWLDARPPPYRQGQPRASRTRKSVLCRPTGPSGRLGTAGTRNCSDRHREMAPATSVTSDQCS